MRRASSHPQATAEPSIRSQSASKRAVEKMRRSSSAIPTAEKNKGKRHCTACGSVNVELFQRDSGLQCLPCIRQSEGNPRADAMRRKASMYAPKGSSLKHSSPTEIEPTTSDSRFDPRHRAGVPVVPPLDFTRLRAAKKRVAPYKYNTPTYSPSTASEVSTVKASKPSIPIYEYNKGVYSVPKTMTVTTKSMRMSETHKSSDMRALAAAPVVASGAGVAEFGQMANASGTRPSRKESRAAGPPSRAQSRAKLTKDNARLTNPEPAPKKEGVIPLNHQSPGFPPGSVTVHFINAMWSLCVGQKQ